MRSEEEKGGVAPDFFKLVDEDALRLEQSSLKWMS
jgi:hypothetical protein